MEFTIKHTRRFTSFSIQVPRRLSSTAVEALLHKCAQEVERELSAHLLPNSKTGSSARLPRSAPKGNVNLGKGEASPPAVEQLGGPQLAVGGEPKSPLTKGPGVEPEKSVPNQDGPLSQSRRRRLRRRAARKAQKEARKAPAPGQKDDPKTSAAGLHLPGQTPVSSKEEEKRLAEALSDKSDAEASLAKLGLQPEIGPDGIPNLSRKSGSKSLPSGPIKDVGLSPHSLKTREEWLARWSRASRDVAAIIREAAAPVRGTWPLPPRPAPQARGPRKE